MNSDTRTRENLLSDEQRLHFGELAGQAFNNPIFVIWHNLMLERTMRAIDAAPPEHSKEVMWQKLTRNVLHQMAKDLEGMVHEAQRIYAEAQQQNSPEAQEQRRLDEQGFGLNYDQRSAS